MADDLISVWRKATGEQMALFAGRSGPYFHGTRWPLQPGDILEGGRFQSNQGYGQPGEHVYVTDRRDVAWSFAEAGYGPPHDLDARPKVYEVEPLDGIEADPDEAEMFGSFRGHRFRVVRDVATRSATGGLRVTAGSTRTVYRGVNVWVAEEDLASVIEGASSPRWVVEQLVERGFDADFTGRSPVVEGEGVGVWWTTDRQIAEKYASSGALDGYGDARVGVFLEGEVSESDVREDHGGYSSESPAMLRPGAPVTITGVAVSMPSGIPAREDYGRREFPLGPVRRMRMQTVAARTASLPAGVTIRSYEYHDPFVRQGREPRLSDDSWVYVAEHQGRIVGTLRVRQRRLDGVMEIWRVDVRDDWQRQGIATELLERARQDHGRIDHSPMADRTPEGQAWSQVVGARDQALLDQLTLTEEDDSADQRRTLIAWNGAAWVGDIQVYGRYYDRARGKVEMIAVEPFYQRRGVATWLFEQAQQRWSDLPVRHSDDLTDDGRAWQRSLGSAEEIIDLWQRVVTPA